MPTIMGLRVRISNALKKISEIIYPSKADDYYAIYDIGKEKLANDSKRALIIYTIHAIHYHIKSQTDNYPGINTHSMWRESVEMVKILNELGYIVDYLDCGKQHKINWNKYDLIIDEQNNLINCPKDSKAKKIAYSTGCYWMDQNISELIRLKQFKKRNAIGLPSSRQATPRLSDEYADILIHMENEGNISNHSPSVKKYQINTTSVSNFKKIKKDFKNSKNNFIWIGGDGFILKGLDLVVEAFCNMTDCNLYIAGKVENDPLFSRWFHEKIKDLKNINYLGWVDVTSEDFQNTVNKSIGVIYPSASDVCPSSITQMLHCGLIPIVTRTANVRAENLGIIIDSENDIEIIAKIVSYVKKLNSMDESELEKMSENVRDFALKNHTLEHYSTTFRNIIKELQN